MRGYFGIGVEGISKSYNVGALFRGAHAFGASFVFTVAASYERRKGAQIDTSDSLIHLPFYGFPSVETLMLPSGCQLVGVELTDDAIELPSFQHPLNAAYIMGPERSSLSPACLERCDYVVKIPTRFCLNVSQAGLLVMYDRQISRGRHAPRPVRPGGPTEEMAEHVHGGPIFRTKSGPMQPYRQSAPLAEIAEAEDFGGAEDT